MSEEAKETAVTIQPAPRVPMREMLTVLKDTGDAALFQAFARDIIEREVAQARFGEDGQLARVFAQSGAFDKIGPDAQGVALAMTKIQLGRSWKMPPADAMEAIFLINGRPSVATKYIAGKLCDAGLAWDIEWDEDKDGTCTGCHLHLKRIGASGTYEPIMEKINGVARQAKVSFTRKDADSAEITDGGKKIKLSEKWNFKSWPSDMYFARCVSRVKNRYAPNILSGVMSVEEAEDSHVPQALPLAAEATAERTADLGQKLKQQKALAAAAAPAPAAPAEAPAAAAAQAPAPAAESKPVATYSAPWSDRSGMVAAFTAEKNRLGEAKFKAVTAGVMMGGLKHDAPEALDIYGKMKAASAEDIIDDGDTF